MAFELDLTCIKIQWYTKFQINMSKDVGEKCGILWRTDGRTETRTDGHHHTIIRPVWRRAYKNYPLLLNIIWSSTAEVKISPASRISDFFKAKRAHNGGINTNSTQNWLRMHHLHQFFKKNPGGSPPPDPHLHEGVPLPHPPPPAALSTDLATPPARNPLDQPLHRENNYFILVFS